ncbi:MAG TPA: hypothetical protein VED18_04330 [Candidatus Sulfotelmatobacter sp.]|nr:hypothetical protein [Candidatus Sulfotelmatobacter sp.]
MRRPRSVKRLLLEGLTGVALCAAVVAAVALATRDPGAAGPSALAAAAQPSPAPRAPTVAEEADRVGQAAGRLAEDEAARRFARTFAVTPQQVADLRDQKLGFGDVAAALAVARVTHKGLNTVVALWANERLDWDDVAARLGAPRRQVVRQLRRAQRALGGLPEG